jgi:hypothetical protein
MSKYKILLLVANHTCNNIKYNISLNNISIMKNFVNNIVIIDTIGERYSKLLYNDLKKDDKIINYFFINNDNYFDFGKWIFALNKIDISNYDYILFLNDSILITNEIKNYFHYIDNLMGENIDLYAYNDSTQIKYHYQSYLFLLKRENINRFIDFFENKKPLIHDLISLVHNVELNITEIYDNHDVFLKIGEEYNKSKNLYWENEELYQYLISKNIFALIKLKKIYDIQNEYKINIYGNNIEDFDHEFYKSYYELNELNNTELVEHFIKIGQFEGRKFKKDFNCILPKYYREKLDSLGLLYFFDVPYDFDVYYYKKNNSELSNHSYIDCMKHYINHGFYEGRVYNKNDNKNNYLNNIYINILSKFNFTVDNKINKDGSKDISTIIIPESFNLYTYMLLNNYLDQYGYFGIIQKYIVNDIDNSNSFEKNKLEKILSILDIKIYKKIYDNLSNLDSEHILQYFINNELKSKNIYKMPKDFDYKMYKKLYKDISNFSNDDIDIHYLKYGIFENRIYKIPDDFDSNIYKSIYKDVEKLNDEELKIHYLFYGIQEKRIYKLPLDFDHEFYKSLYKDLEKLNSTQLKEHYMNHGIKENRLYKIPDDFNCNLYKSIYDDIKDFSDQELINHYLKNGFSEGRIYKLPDDFNPVLYKSMYKDLSKLNNKELKDHYLKLGVKEKRIYKISSKVSNSDNNYKDIYTYIATTRDTDANKDAKDAKDVKDAKDAKDAKDKNIDNENKKNKLPEDFNPGVYKSIYNDLAKLNNEELIDHYLKFGIKEKRIYKKLNSKLPEDFNPNLYKQIYKDLEKLTKKQLIEHYLNNGINEGRIYKLPEDFNSTIYKNKNKDLSKFNDNELIDHYLTHGIREKRIYK